MSSSNEHAKAQEEEGDISASLKVEATDFCVDPPEHLCELEAVERYKEAFSQLWPDSNGFVHKTEIIQFFQSVLGPLYSDEMSECLIDIMEPNQEGNISLDSFVQAFSLRYWTAESMAAMHQVLALNPDLMNKAADWKKILGRLGIDISEQEMNKIIDQAQKGATALLSKELEKSKDSLPTQEEVKKRSTQILDAIKERMHLLDVGGAGVKDMSAGESNLEKANDEANQKEEKSTVRPEEHPAELSN